VDFYVSKSGKVQGVKVNTSGNHLLDTEAMRVISSMPDWSPGMQAGKPVDVYMQIPVDFSLDKVVKKPDK
jgi:protein TonB